MFWNICTKGWDNGWLTDHKYMDGAFRFCCCSRYCIAVFMPLRPYKWAATWDLQQCGMCDQQSLRSACALAQSDRESDQSLCYALEYSMSVKLLPKRRLELLSLKGGRTGSSESTIVEMPHCWKSHVVAHMQLLSFEQTCLEIQIGSSSKPLFVCLFDMILYVPSTIFVI